jgi:threonine/homoserine/homoserine lactone efflux protein
MHFAFAIVLLLLVPGPTNTILATAGATLGFARSLPLLIGELAGYDSLIATIRMLFVHELRQDPWVGAGLRVLSAAYLSILAASLWRAARSPSAAAITLGRVFVTTLLNPKGLIVALVLIPPNDAATVPYMIEFSLLVPLLGSGWVALGHLFDRGTKGNYWAAVPKAASVGLVLFAFMMLASAISLLQ